jgi:hypothetical protein
VNNFDEKQFPLLIAANSMGSFCVDFIINKTSGLHHHFLLVFPTKTTQLAFMSFKNLENQKDPTPFPLRPARSRSLHSSQSDRSNHPGSSAVLKGVC